MVELEIIGSEENIERIQGKLVELTDQPVRRYDHKGADGKSGIMGLIIPVVPGVLTSIVEFIGHLVPDSRGVSIKVEGLELDVRNLEEASEAITLLVDRGLLPKKV